MYKKHPTLVQHRVNPSQTHRVHKQTYINIYIHIYAQALTSSP